MAVHESGHALVAALSPHADPVAKVTILPAGQALGVTEQLPLVERHLYGEDYLNESLAVRLGGRAAELVVLGQGSTGAANDLASATDLAIRMVREFGLSSKLGPVGYPEGGSVFLGGGGGPGLSSRPYAESTQAVIDAEVSRLVREAEQNAISLHPRATSGTWTGWPTCSWRRRRWTGTRSTGCSAWPCRNISPRAGRSRRAGLPPRRPAPAPCPGKPARRSRARWRRARWRRARWRRAPQQRTRGPRGPAAARRAGVTAGARPAEPIGSLLMRPSYAARQWWRRR